MTETRDAVNDPEKISLLKKTTSADLAPASEYGSGSDENVFVYSHGLTSEEAEDLREIHGRNELPEKVIPKWFIFLSLFWQPMPVMIWLAIIVEIAISNYLDMTILLIIQFANASIAFYEINKAGDAVAALKASLRPEVLRK